MKRTLLTDLNNWLVASNRKPLIIRGARQVGKTWLIRQLAQQGKRQLIELNFEKDSSHASLFNSNNPADILLNIGASLGQKIVAEESLLFLDEIQVVPELLSKLRWFAEDLPALAVVATGSLLDFVLADHSFSMPVGRISYMYLEPLSFEEFILAKEYVTLADYVGNYQIGQVIPDAIHQQLMALFKEYLLIGGLPAVVLDWTTTRSINSMNQIKNDLLSTYRDDFSKYQGRIVTERLDEVISAVPRMLGKKFIYSHVNKLVQATTIQQILSLLEKARLCHRIQSSSANGIPLAAEIRARYFKEIFLDVGLTCTRFGLNFNQIQGLHDLTMINSGVLAEQVVGQLLRTIEPSYVEPALYCWHREEVGASAEIDYLIQHNDRIIPIEVKSGSTGSLKSLHLFMGLKKGTLAIRVNSDFPSKVKVNVIDSLGQAVSYELLSIPFYLVGQIHRLLAAI
jgi:predicted AAA+ superfamily ATPase